MFLIDKSDIEFRTAEVTLQFCHEVGLIFWGR